MGKKHKTTKKKPKPPRKTSKRKENNPRCVFLVFNTCNGGRPSHALGWRAWGIPCMLSKQSYSKCFPFFSIRSHQNAFPRSALARGAVLLLLLLGCLFLPPRYLAGATAAAGGAIWRTSSGNSKKKVIFNPDQFLIWFAARPLNSCDGTRMAGSFGGGNMKIGGFLRCACSVFPNYFFPCLAFLLGSAMDVFGF